jgi:hypothetical protein
MAVRTGIETSLGTALPDHDALPELVDTLFEEAERRERRRRFRSLALVLLLGIGIGAAVISSGNGSVPTRQSGSTASPAQGAASFGDPSTEVIVESQSIDGHASLFVDTISSTLGSRAKTLAQMTAIAGKAPGITTELVGGHIYRTNPIGRARVCDPTCMLTSRPWIERVTKLPASSIAGVLFDPIRLRSALALVSGGTLTELSVTRLDGVRVTEYRGTVTRDKFRLLARDDREIGLFQALSNAFPEYSQPIPGEDPKSVTAYLWVDRSGRARRLQLDWRDLSVTTSGGAGQPVREQRAMQTRQTTVLLKDFGKSMSFSPPAASQTMRVSASLSSKDCWIYLPRGRSSC